MCSKLTPAYTIAKICGFIPLKLMIAFPGGIAQSRLSLRMRVCMEIAQAGTHDVSSCFPRLSLQAFTYREKDDVRTNGNSEDRSIPIPSCCKPQDIGLVGISSPLNKGGE